jgi:hypothetical protein
VLHAGDSLFLHSDQPFVLAAPVGSPCRILMVAGSAFIILLNVVAALVDWPRHKH